MKEETLELSQEDYLSFVEWDLKQEQREIDAVIRLVEIESEVN